MSYEILTGLVAMGLGVLSTLAFQAHRKAQKAVKEAEEAVANADRQGHTVRSYMDTHTRQTEAHLKVMHQDIDKRIQKLEIRVEDVSNRLAAQQIKR